MNSPEMSRGSVGLSTDPPVPAFPWTDDIEKVLARYERRLIDHALQNAGGVKRRAAHLLGISRYALERRLNRVNKALAEATPQLVHSSTNGKVGVTP